MWARYSDYEILKGYIYGEIILNVKEIRFEGKIISIESIKKLDFNFYDQEGSNNSNVLYGSLNGVLVRGVNNSLTIYFKDNKERKIFLQQKKTDDYESLRLLLIEYCKKGLISFLALTSIICSSYKEVQELKEKCFK